MVKLVASKIPKKTTQAKKLNRQFGKSWVSIQKLSSEVDKSVLSLFCLLAWFFKKDDNLESLQ